MKKYISITVAIIVLTISMLSVMQAKVFAANENIQVVTTDDNYIIYVSKDLANEEFKFATSKTQLDPESIELNYINSVKSEDGSWVAVIKKENSEESKYLYIKDEKKSTIKLSLENATTKADIEKVEKITNIIDSETTVEKQIEEQIDKVKHEETIGVLNFKEDADYKYVFEKSPSENYKKLKEYTDKLKNEYSKMDGYTKIEFVKEYNALLDSLIEKATENNAWKSVEDKKIEQEADALNGDEYVYIINQIKDGEIKYDVKFLTATRTDVEPEIKEEKIETKRTAKLPVTGDSLILFGILAAIVIALIIVLIKMKNIKHNGRH